MFEPEVDLVRVQDCLRKLQVAQKLRKGGWRDKAGVAGCKE